MNLADFVCINRFVRSLRSRLPGGDIYWSVGPRRSLMFTWDYAPGEWLISYGFEQPVIWLWARTPESEAAFVAARMLEMRNAIQT